MTLEQWQEVRRRFTALRGLKSEMAEHLAYEATTMIGAPALRATIEGTTDLLTLADGWTLLVLRHVDDDTLAPEPM